MKGKKRDHIRLRTLSSGYYSAEERDRYDSISSIDSLDSAVSFFLYSKHYSNLKIVKNKKKV